MDWFVIMGHIYASGSLNVRKIELLYIFEGFKHLRENSLCKISRLNVCVKAQGGKNVLTKNTFALFFWISRACCLWPLLISATQEKKSLFIPACFLGTIHSRPTETNIC
jgi:hypothetical protein